MKLETDIVVSPEVASSNDLLRKSLAGKISVKESEITSFRILRKSIDARNRAVKINLKILVGVGGEDLSVAAVPKEYKDVSSAREAVIIGAGPAGLFAALRLIELGVKPLVFDRGKNIDDRKADIAAIHKQHHVDADSNYCFGEGGAGTFSDGKLYTRSNKRGNVQSIIEDLFLHGAQEEILYDAHPHIGTNRLPAVISNIRKTIENAGGKVHYNYRLSDLVIANGKIRELCFSNGEKVNCSFVILATGHSARDIYTLLQNKNIEIEAKAFAMGVRAEHSQELIDSIQYHGSRGKFLPASSYSLVEQVAGRGVFSFCMCPGGVIVPAATSSNEIVVNGMSSSLRNTPYANSGIVVEVRPEDYKKYASFGPLAGLKYQQELEELAFSNGGGGLVAPAQRISDFVYGKKSSSLPKTSYHPGVESSEMRSWLPNEISMRLAEGFKMFDKKMKGYLTSEAIIVGVESRTSSPVRIPRDKDTLQHVQIKGLYPCGEGAGYAGGIVSSAIDGVNCADKLCEEIKKT